MAVVSHAQIQPSLGMDCVFSVIKHFKRHSRQVQNLLFVSNTF